MIENSEWRTSLAELTKAIGHPVRIQILQELSIGSCIVSELTGKLEVEASLLSKHLAVLRDAGLIECEPEWRCRRYHLKSPEAIGAILTALNEALEESRK